MSRYYKPRGGRVHRGIPFSRWAPPRPEKLRAFDLTSPRIGSRAQFLSPHWETCIAEIMAAPGPGHRLT